jgi:hypothetical protein
MTELFFNPRPVHDGRESGSSNEGRMSLITRCSVFKDHTAGATGLVASTLCSGHKKRPLAQGARQRRGRDAADLGSSYEAALFVVRSKSDRGV